ncbi:MAG TPA: vitamin B12 dependent-methionine synthase activation domain-containing protein [bacterium]|nr:vitamin B12 dependent-methionine synthase activation domain-containing protein [bacterium]HOM26655.1 vitamin B12 dependent-methionine synthase activation domain-containing protein [bacterium]
MEILKDFKIEVNKEYLIERLKIEKGSEDENEFLKLIGKALEIGRPKAVYIEGFIDEKLEEAVIINGVKFESKILRKNLENVEKVFVFIATCGKELDRLNFKEDILKNYWWDTIKEYFLGMARRYLFDYLKERYFLKDLIVMSPGASEKYVWPIEQQRELFSLFGDVENLIGVKLTESFLMVPNKSISGFLFSSEKDYRSCKICRRKNCPGRTVEFDENLWKIYQK